MNTPTDLFSVHSRLIRKIIFHMLIKTGYFRFDDMAELLQQVTLLLLERQEKITSGFSGRAKFTTYLSVVVSNICKELIRKRLHERSMYSPCPLFPGTDDLAPVMIQIRDASVDAESRIILREMIQRLDVILLTYLTKRTWMLVCLKALWEIRIEPQEIEGATTLSEEELVRITQLIEQLNELPAGRPKGQIYALLTQIGGIVEKKQRTDDAIRKWIHDRIGEILVLLNGTPPVHGFTEETLQILFEYYCHEQKKFSPQNPLENLLYDNKITA